MHLTRPTRAALAAATLATTLAGCGGNDDEPAALPRLAAATPATLSGSCADLASRLTLANTTITSAPRRWPRWC